MKSSNKDIGEKVAKIPSDEKRVIIIYIIFLILFAIVTARLYILASGGDDAASVLSGQYSRRLELAERRGYILSRELIPIGSDTKPHYIAVVTPTPCTDKYTAAGKLSNHTLEKTAGELRELFAKGLPFTVTVDTPLSGTCVRTYSCYKTNLTEAIHATGYVSGGKGMTGLQRSFEPLLGKGGAFYGRLSASYGANAGGQILDGTVAQISDENFGNISGIITTLDKSLQQCVEQIADAYISSGAIVVLSAKGEVLATVSRPVFDPNQISKYLDSEKGEFVNRALESFAPGSVFKTVVAAAALCTDLSFFEKEYTCEGSVVFGNMRHRCHKPDGHGTLTMKDAFAMSCNCYFIMLGTEIGMDRIFETAKKLGIGSQGKLYGLGSFHSTLPQKSHYPPSEVANNVIGQGQMMLSPIEAAEMMLACATGILNEPYIVKGFTDGVSTTFRKQSNQTRVLDPHVVSKLKELLGSCISNGTGSSAAPIHLTAGGKTATAQTGRYSGKSELNHLWFAGVYPLDTPQIGVAVVMDFCEENSENTELAFRAICEEYCCLAQLR